MSGAECLHAETARFQEDVTLATDVDVDDDAVIHEDPPDDPEHASASVIPAVYKVFTVILSLVMIPNKAISFVK